MDTWMYIFPTGEDEGSHPTTIPFPPTTTTKFLFPPLNNNFQVIGKVICIQNITFWFTFQNILLNGLTRKQNVLKLETMCLFF